MNEQAARDVVLMWAIETSDHERRILSDDDRMYASRAAGELAQWEASDKNQPVSPELFLHKRAEQVNKRIAERTPAFSKFTARRNWARPVGIVLPLLALVTGFAADRIADPHRVDLLSAPLLLIVFWNLAVYVGVLLWPLLPALRRRRSGSGLLARLSTGSLSAPRRLPQGLAAALGRFGEEWVRLSLPLTTARFKRIIHLAAACLALGAIASLYARGILSQYRAGWESTFLGAEQVHALLSFLFAPAIAVFGLQGFSLAEVRALEFAPSAAPAAGAEGAKWVHLYAATLFLLVILPRLALAAFAGWKEKRLAARFPIDLSQPYFRKLTARLGPDAPAVLRVFPYSFTVDEARDRNLTAVAQMLLGEQARVMLRPSTGYGETPPQPSATDAGSADIALTVALFNLSATPEKENHGAFLDQLAAGTADRLLALVDESAYLERMGAQAGGDARVQERIALWRRFCELHRLPFLLVNLADPRAHADEIERASALLARRQ